MYEWNFNYRIEDFLEEVGGEVLECEEGCLLDNYLISTEGFSLEHSGFMAHDGQVRWSEYEDDFPAGIIMVTERYLTPNSSGYHAVFDDTEKIWDRWYDFVRVMEEEENA